MNRFLDLFSGVYFAPEGEGGGGAGDPPADPPGGQDPPAGDLPKTYDEAYVKKLRDEAAGNRTKLRELEERLKKHDDEQLSETEKLKKQAQDASEKLTATEQKARTRIARAETISEAAKLNFHDGGDAFALIKDAIEFDDEGEPKNVEVLMKDLAKSKPWMIKGEEQPGGGSPANPAGGRGGTGPKWDGKTPPPSWGTVLKR